MEHNHILLSEYSIGESHVLHKGLLCKSTTVDNFCHGSFTNSKNIEFLTHLSVANSGFCSEHLEQLAVACPNLEQLNLMDNITCLKRLQGLRAIAAYQKLQGLSISGIPVGQLESCVKLWEILIDLQLTYLRIDLCCLACSELDKKTIISLHQKCLKLKALESYSRPSCTTCSETEQSLLLFNFPSLIHCVTNIENVVICDRLKYLFYMGERYFWDIANWNNCAFYPIQ